MQGREALRDDQDQNARPEGGRHVLQIQRIELGQAVNTWGFNAISLNERHGSPRAK